MLDHQKCARTHLTPFLTGALYEAFEPAEAKRIADRLDIHYTPKHGSWLNMAEMELSALARQCLDRRIPETAGAVVFARGHQPT